MPEPKSREPRQGAWWLSGPSKEGTGLQSFTGVREVMWFGLTLQAGPDPAQVYGTSLLNPTTAEIYLLPERALCFYT